MSDCFLVTSAIYTNHSIFSTDERLDQTLETYESIRNRFPDSIIVTIDSGQYLSEEVASVLKEHSNHLIDLTEDPYLRDIYQRGYNTAQCKNVCESYSLQQILRLGIEFGHDDRLAKITGRYQITNDFKLDHPWGKITLGGPYEEMVWPDTFTDISHYYMTIGIVWDGSVHDQFMHTLKMSHEDILWHLNHPGKYCDLEHALYKNLPFEITNGVEYGAIGVVGLIGSDGSVVKG